MNGGHELATFAAIAFAGGVMTARPRIGRIRVEPAAVALTGLAVLLAIGALTPGEALRSAASLAPALAAIAAMMITAAAAERSGAIEWLASVADRGAATPGSLFTRVFILSGACALLLNNDAAVLLLTPAVLAIATRRDPNDARLALALAFAVFMATGVAALPTSNPMNLIAVSRAGIDSSVYISRMVPIALVTSLVTFALLRFLVARDLLGKSDLTRRPRVVLSREGRALLVLLIVVLASHPISASLGIAAWPAQIAGATIALLIARDPAEIVSRGVSWQVIIFLAAAAVCGDGLAGIGATDTLARAFSETGLAGIATISAAGSAIVNNHPMAIASTNAVLAMPGAGTSETLAALVGGDLGPRLLPTGSLAGMLWLSCLRRHGVDVRVREFALIGAAVTLPALAAGLLVLSALS